MLISWWQLFPSSRSSRPGRGLPRPRGHPAPRRLGPVHRSRHHQSCWDQGWDVIMSMINVIVVISRPSKSKVDLLQLVNLQNKENAKVLPGWPRSPESKLSSNPDFKCGQFSTGHNKNLLSKYLFWFLSYGARDLQFHMCLHNWFHFWSFHYHHHHLSAAQLTDCKLSAGSFLPELRSALHELCSPPGNVIIFRNHQNHHFKMIWQRWWQW